MYKISDLNKLNIKDVQSLYNKYVNPSQSSAIKIFGFGKDLVDFSLGKWIYTQTGKKILDFTGGFGVLNHGHNHPRIIEARIKFQKKNRMEIHKNYLSQYTAALSANIANLLPKDLNKVYLPNSGAEANEGAIKLAYKYFNGKKKFLLHSDISFHGKLLGTGSISSSPETDFNFPGLKDVDCFKYNDFESLQQKITKYKGKIYAIIIEPFSASSLRVLSHDFMDKLRKICDKEKIILIFDEVFTGWAKTGKLFYFFNYNNIIPDILTFSKSFGGGKSSISGYVVRDKFLDGTYNSLKDFNLHSTTYNAFGEENITAMEAINIIIDEDYCKKAEKIGKCINSELLKLQNIFPETLSEIRGFGALQGIKININKLLLFQLTKTIPFLEKKNKRFFDKLCYSSIVNRLYEKHNILTSFSLGKDICLWISPSLIVNEKDIKYVMSCLEETLKWGLNKLVLDLINSRFKSIL